MKRRLRLNLNGALLLSACFAFSRGIAALTPTEWSHQQTVEVTTAGLNRLPLTAATFDAARAGLPDLRLINASGQEIPFLIDRDPGQAPPPPAAFAPKTFSATMTERGTQLTLASGTTQKLAAIELETSAAFFLKAAHLEISDDGTNWQSLGPAEPLFRQFGVEQLRLSLHDRAAAYVRITLDDLRSRPVEFSRAKLFPVTERSKSPPLTTVGVTVVRQEEFAAQTRLTLALEGRHVPLAELEFEVKDALFMRRVAITVRRTQDGISSEDHVASDTLYRVALPGAEPRAKLVVPLNFVPGTSELFVHITNIDSPPLVITGVRARQRATNLFFMAAQPGTYRLLSGNAQIAAPRYDLTAFASEMRTAEASSVTAGAVAATPGYQPRDSFLPEVPLTGAPLDVAPWKQKKSIRITKPGVQELEVDAATLAASRFGTDVRVMHRGNQIPYVVETPNLHRALTVVPIVANDPKRPTVSIWKVPLPHGKFPTFYFRLTSHTPLFQRQFRLYEKYRGMNGEERERDFASGPWSRTAEPDSPKGFAFYPHDIPEADTVWIETDNGDNPPISIEKVEAFYPVIRLIFKVTDTEDLSLIYDNPKAKSPRYDLALVAAQLLTASRNVATLEGTAPPVAQKQNPFAGLNSGYLFWGALALVVIVLLVAVAKLLPKPPSV
ncbi:DUF3999 family protein [Oleiharenicola lentus]|uniref:DUF3999 family protein n=1 Tax=Oleiharenicola lentus TaxID=2508720 RepID=UPI003F6616C5